MAEQGTESDGAAGKIRPNEVTLKKLALNPELEIDLTPEEGAALERLVAAATATRIPVETARMVEAEIIDGYMPPYPREDTQPTVVVSVGNWMLRRSRGDGVFSAPGSRPDGMTGLFWDVYGDDFGTVEEARAALAQAPAVPKGEPFVTFHLPLPTAEDEDDDDE